MTNTVNSNNSAINDKSQIIATITGLSRETLYLSFPNSFLRKKFEETLFGSVKFENKNTELKYNRGIKRWEIPLLKLPEITKIPGIHVSENLSFNQVINSYKELSSAIAKAKNSINKNPFNANTKDIELAKPEIIIRLNEQGFIQVTGFSPTAITFMKNSHLILDNWMQNKSGSISSLNLTEFLKDARDKGLTFAVHSECYKKLIDHKDTREQLTAGSNDLPTKEILNSMALPFLEHYTSSRLTKFRLKGLATETAEQLVADLFTGENYGRTKISKKHGLFSGLDIETTCSLILTLTSFQKTPYLSEKTANILREHIDNQSKLSNVNLALTCNDKHNDNFVFIKLGNSNATIIYSERLRKAAKNKLPPSGSWNGSSLLGKDTSPNGIQKKFITIPFKDSLQIRENLTEEGFNCTYSDEYLEYTEKYLKRIKFREECKYFRELDDIELNLINKPLESKLYPHQRVAVEWMRTRDFGLLGDDMGLGKTLSSLCFADELYNSEKTEFIIVACPNSLVYTWQNECNDWLNDKELLVLPKAPKKRLKELDEILEFQKSVFGIVINYELIRVPTVLEKLAEIANSRTTLLMLDESQRVKNATSKTFQAIKTIAQHCERRFLLSGTPTPRDIADIWSQMNIIDNGERFGNNYISWLETIAELGTKYSAIGVKRFYSHKVKSVKEQIKEVLLRRSKEEVVNLPEKVFSTRKLELKGTQLERYKEICSELLIRMTSSGGKKYTRQINNIMEHYLRGVQIASNPRLIDPTWEGTPAKFKELDLLINDIVKENGKKVVIWTNYVDNVTELVERYKQHGTLPYYGNVSKSDRDKYIKQFQDKSKGSPQILIAIPAAGGVGITLTTAQTAIYIDKTWNAEHWMQSIDRVHRIGQKGTVNIISLEAGKIDKLIAKNLKRKTELQKSVLDKDESIQEQLTPSFDELIDALNNRK